jgi:hypothetical protein
MIVAVVDYTGGGLRGPAIRESAEEDVIDFADFLGLPNCVLLLDPFRQFTMDGDEPR